MTGPTWKFWLWTWGDAVFGGVIVICIVAIVVLAVIRAHAGICPVQLLGDER